MDTLLVMDNKLIKATFNGLESWLNRKIGESMEQFNRRLAANPNYLKGYGYVRNKDLELQIIVESVPDSEEQYEVIVYYREANRLVMPEENPCNEIKTHIDVDFDSDQNNFREIVYHDPKLLDEREKYDIVDESLDSVLERFHIFRDIGIDVDIIQHKECDTSYTFQYQERQPAIKSSKKN